ncbi:MAG: helicase-related protein, partial [Clostridia bacterium]
ILLNKSRSVDSLIMSATPIPRVIALSVYGDIALSELVTRKSASNVKTYIVNDNKLDGLYGFIAERVLLGEQAYIVCPLVEDSDGLEIFSAKTAYSELSKSYPKIRFALTHGKQNDKQKQEIMQAFMSGDIDVLVATSVVEVGIDCQNASVMAVLNSDRFGLASLHQLRGRVGRDPSKQGFCFLHTSLQKENQRLKVLQNFDDGKSIAEEDAKLRGYGDFLGISQSGGNNNLLLTKDFVAECNALADSLMLTRGQSLQQKPIIKEYIDSLRNIEMM